VIQDILNQLTNIQLDLNIVVNGGGLTGDPLSCLPGINGAINLNLPGLPNLQGCFNFSGFGNLGGNISNCLNGVLGQFGNLGNYFAQFNWNYNDLMACLNGMITIPTITVDDFLDNLLITLNNILGLLNSIQVNFPVYNGFYNFFVDFCANHYSSSGFATGASTGGGGGSFSNTVSVTGTSVVMSAASLGTPTSAVAAPAAAYAVLQPKKGKAKRAAMSCGENGICKKTFKKLKPGTYTASIEVHNTTSGVPSVVTRSTVKIK
jgi:hypothetical protein